MPLARISLWAIGWVLAVLGACCVHAQQKEFSITENSRIVVNKEQADALRAATELQQYIETITGRKVPIESDGAVTPDKYIIAVGDNSYTAPLAEPLKKLNRDGFIIRSMPRMLLIRGNKKSLRHPADFPAIDYAVSYFLQNYAGVRWYLPAPGNLGTVVPKKSDILLSEFEDVQQPDFTIRLWGGLIDEKLEAEWNRHNRSGMSYMIHHNIPGILGEKEFAEHPDWFALVNGKRSGQAGNMPQVCTSNPELVKFLVSFANDYFDKYPDQDVVPMGQDDGMAYCECDACKASGATLSDRFYKFYAEIARQLQEKHPGKQVGLLCYASIKPLPTEKIELDHLAIALPWDRSAWFDPAVRDKDQSLTREWSQHVGRLFLWNWYWNAGFITPQVFPRTVDRVVKFAGSLGNCDGMYSETYSHIALPGPKLWVLAQLLWDADADVDALLNDFCDGMFGKAAPAMRKYYDVQEEAWCRQEVVDDDLFDKWRYNIAQLDIFSADDMASQRACLNEAAAAADSDDDRARVDMMAQAFTQFDLTWRLYQQMKSAVRIGEIDNEEKAIEAEKTIDAILNAHRQLDEFQKSVVASRIELQYYMGDWWIPNYEWLIADLSGYLSKTDQKDRIRTIMGRLGEQYPDLEAGRLAAAIGQSLGLPTAPNLVINPNLEKTGFEVNGIQKFDWVVDEACPAGWYRWPQEYRDVFFRGADGSEREFAGIKGSSAPGARGLYIQVLKVEPAKRYLVSFDAFAQMVSAGAGGGILVQYLDEKQEWLGLLTAEEEAAGTKRDAKFYFNTGVANGRWQRMLGTFSVPSRAHYAVVQLSATNFAKDDSILFRSIQLIPME